MQGLVSIASEKKKKRVKSNRKLIVLCNYFSVFSVVLKVGHRCGRSIRSLVCIEVEKRTS